MEREQAKSRYPNYDRTPTEQETQTFITQRVEEIVAVRTPPNQHAFRQMIERAVQWYAEQYPNEVIYETNTPQYETETLRKFAEQ